MKHNNGFTLIELVIVIIVVAILATIAVPSYSSYMRQSRRADAKNALAELQLAEEKYRGNNPSYTTNPVALGLTSVTGATSWPSSQGYYTLTIASASTTTYSATASVNTSSVQNSDSTECPALSVTQSGFVVDSTASCWGLQ